jgi:predicted MFS family arabinose efflux permease
MFLLLWLAQPQGWTGVQTAFVVLVLRAPTLIFGLPIGRAVDRFGGRPMAILDMAARAGLMVLLVLSSAAGRPGTLPLPAVLVLGGLAGALSPASYAAVRWIIPRVVPGERVARANAVVALGDQVPLILGTALVGPSLTLLGPVYSVFVPAGMFLIALGLAFGLPSAPPDRFSDPDPSSPVPPRRWPRRVVALMALSTAYYFAYGPFETASPNFIRSQMHAGPGTYSLLWSLFGIGALVTLPLAPALARRRPGLVNAIGAVSWGLVMLPVVLVGSLAVAVPMFLAGGLIWGPYTAVEATALQRWVDPGRHGAVFGVQHALLTTATPIGAALGAVALEAVRPGLILAASAAACAGAGLLALSNRGLRVSS